MANFKRNQVSVRARKKENTAQQSTEPADIITSAARPRPTAAAKVSILAKRMSEALMEGEAGE
jgi:hypothetical protein